MAVSTDAEFMGGGHVEDIDEEDEPEELDSLQVKPLQTLNLAEI